jgi:hypothetical protein
MIYMWFTGKNYYNLAVEKDRDQAIDLCVKIVIIEFFVMQ